MKGQSSIEFVILISFLFLVFIGFIVVVKDRIQEQERVNQATNAVQLADLVEREILLASQVSDGYMRVFTLPSTMRGEEYNLTLEHRDTLVVRGAYSENDYLRFLGPNVTLIVPTDAAAPHRAPRFDVDTGAGRQVLLQKNGSGIYVRKDCLLNGLGPFSCPATYDNVTYELCPLTVCP